LIDEQIVEKLRTEAHDMITASDAYDGEEGDQKVYDLVENLVLNYAREAFLTANQKHLLINRIYATLRGLDVLQPLIDDKSITEIMINSHKEIFVEREGRVSQAQVTFESEEKLDQIIKRIVGKVNRIVNESSPIVDARLLDGSRVNVVLPPIALKGPSMTIRKFPEKPVTIQDLIKWGALPAEVSDFLEKLVIAKFNVFIGGGTGSGKTTFLNVLSNFIPKDERIITIEDSAELQIKNVPNLVSLETRNANTEGKGEINIRDLIKSSLRMRPDRVVVGEVRGPEALDMLQAMNTGHDGSLSTGHANSVVDMLSRLETMVLSGANLPIEVIRKQISSAIDIMVHLGRLRDKSRKVLAISEVLDVVNGEIQLNPLFEFIEEDEVDGRIIGGLQPTGNKIRDDFKLQMAGINPKTLKY
jgi:pilus assembly protein CpaF